MDTTNWGLADWTVFGALAGLAFWIVRPFAALAVLGGLGYAARAMTAVYRLGKR